MYSRREFLRCCALGGCGLAAASWFVPSVCGAPSPLLALPLREALFWESLEGGKVRCTTCPNACEAAHGEATRCRTRVNKQGRLYTTIYGRPCLITTDPLEKNPLYHVAPGTEALAAATAGCNLKCSYCQNWDISQVGPEKTKNMDVPPDALIAQAVKRGLTWLTFSYTEPTAYYEYALESARQAKAQGIRVAIVTAGMINPKPLEKLMEFSDAFSVTIKGYTPGFYQDVCGADIKKVWATLQQLVQSKKWVEVVTLVVPGMNDNEAGLRGIARQLAALNPGIPLHFLRFSPAFQLKQFPKTPVKTLETARANALSEGVRFVYLSNLPGHAAANTSCPQCKTVLVERSGFKVLKNDIRSGRCSSCNGAIPGLLGA